MRIHHTYAKKLQSNRNYCNWLNVNARIDLSILNTLQVFTYCFYSKCF